MKHSQLGLGMLAYGLIALGIVLALGGLYAAIYKAGAASVRAEWDEANRKAGERESARKLAEQETLATAKEKLTLAESKAETNLTKWKEAIDDARKQNRSLASCVKRKQKVRVVTKVVPGQPVPITPTLSDESDTGVQFSWEFVSLYDSGWTDDKGEPVFGTPQAILARAGATDRTAPSPYGPQEVVETQAKNSVWCSALKRKYNSLLDTIGTLEKSWSATMATQ